MKKYKNLWDHEIGLAMTEGVIVVPFFIIIWMGMTALFSLLDARLQVQLAAGDAAVEMASSGDCGEADMTLDDMEQTSGMDTGLGSEEGQMIESIAGCQPFAWAHASAGVEKDVSDIPISLGGPDVGVSGQRTLMCNMKPVDGLMDLVATVVSEALGLNDD